MNRGRKNFRRKFNFTFSSLVFTSLLRCRLSSLPLQTAKNFSLQTNEVERKGKLLVKIKFLNDLEEKFRINKEEEKFVSFHRTFWIIKTEKSVSISIITFFLSVEDNLDITKNKQRIDKFIQNLPLFLVQKILYWQIQIDS